MYPQFTRNINCRFVNEVRRQDGEYYPPRTIYCDSVYTQVASVRHTSIITKEEDKVCSLAIFGCDNPRSLQWTIFFYIGKRFCIRGEEEIWKIGPSQFKNRFNPDCITYVEHGSKNYSGCASDLHFENKEVPCPPIPSLNSRCLVFVMDLYFN